jgi:predicted amidohydrolase YtcJ
MTKPGHGDDFYRVNGAGEMLVSSGANFEDFLQPRPDMAPVTESELKAVIQHLVENQWPFRMHATYNETISRALDVYEEVNREIPFDGLHWFFDHCETITDRNMERIKTLGGGHCRARPNGFPGRILRRTLRPETGHAHSANPADARDGYSSWSWHGRYQSIQLQSVPFAPLAYYR